MTKLVLWVVLFLRKKIPLQCFCVWWIPFSRFLSVHILFFRPWCPLEASTKKVHRVMTLNYKQQNHADTLGRLEICWQSNKFINSKHPIIWFWPFSRCGLWRICSKKLKLGITVDIEKWRKILKVEYQSWESMLCSTNLLFL